jgi:hypothetical protein
MLVHLSFCIVCTFWKHKRQFKIYLKSSFEKLEKEKEKEIHLHSEFGPLARLGLSSERGPFPPPDRPRGPSRGRRPRTHAHLPSPIPAADFAGPRISRVPFPKPLARSFPKTLTDRIRGLIFSFHLWGRLRAIKTGPPHLPAPHPTTNRSYIALWWLRPKHRPSRPPLRAARSPCFIPGHSFALGEIALMHSTRWCFSFTR